MKYRTLVLALGVFIVAGAAVYAANAYVRSTNPTWGELPGSTLLVSDRGNTDVMFAAYKGSKWKSGGWGEGYGGYYGSWRSGDPYWGSDQYGGYGYFGDERKTCVWNGYEYKCYSFDRSGW